MDAPTKEMIIERANAKVLHEFHGCATYHAMQIAAAAADRKAELAAVNARFDDRVAELQKTVQELEPPVPLAVADVFGD